MTAESSGLDKHSVAVVAQVVPIGREFFDPCPVGRLPGYLVTEITASVRLALGT